jgi:hypothetical protein
VHFVASAAALVRVNPTSSFAGWRLVSTYCIRSLIR